jgi:hypothetical protein
MIELNQAMTAIIVFLVGQTVAGIWWASKLTTTVRFLAESVDDLRNIVRKGEFSNCSVHAEKIMALEKRMSVCEKRLNAHNGN